MGVLSSIYSWSCKGFVDKDGAKWSGGQIDMLIDRNDEVINICEIKFSSDEYAITDAYEETLRNRASLFKKVTKTTKVLQHTFITTCGLKQNKYSGMIQSEVTMDDLFQL